MKTAIFLQKLGLVLAVMTPFWLSPQGSGLHAQCGGDAYYWPAGRDYTQKQLNGIFMEYREGPPIHFHDGIDIQAEHYTDVYACRDNMRVTSVGGSGSNLSLYLVELDFPNRTFWYTHLEELFFETDDIVNVIDAVGETNSDNHLHFCEGPNEAEINPLRDPETALCPFVDTSLPSIMDCRVETDDTDNELPKSGGIYQVRGNVDFLVQAKDAISSPGGTNVSVYYVGYDLQDAQWVSKANDSYQFDSWLPNDDVEFVYSKSLSSESVYWYTPTNDLTSNGYWNSLSVPDGTYYLWFTVADISGNQLSQFWPIHVTNTTSVYETDDEQLLKEYALLPNYPNPFNPSTTIQFELPRKSIVSLAVYDEQGCVVQELVSQKTYDAGRYDLVWAGTNSLGRSAASGTYFCRLEVQDLNKGELFSQTRKMVLLR